MKKINKEICEDCGQDFVNKPGIIYSICKKCRQKAPGSYEDRCELARQRTQDRWLEPKYQKKVQKSLHIRPNKPERKLLKFLKANWPDCQWKFVGDYSFWVGDKNPDFVSRDGRSLLVELYGDYWHRGEDPQERIKHYENSGYKCFVVWESELKDERGLYRLLRAFCEK